MPSISLQRWKADAHGSGVSSLSKTMFFDLDAGTLGVRTKTTIYRHGFFLLPYTKFPITWYRIIITYESIQWVFQLFLKKKKKTWEAVFAACRIGVEISRSHFELVWLHSLGVHPNDSICVYPLLFIVGELCSDRNIFFQRVYCA